MVGKVICVQELLGQSLITSEQPAGGIQGFYPQEMALKAPEHQDG